MNIIAILKVIRDVLLFKKGYKKDNLLERCDELGKEAVDNHVIIFDLKESNKVLYDKNEILRNEIQSHLNNIFILIEDCNRIKTISWYIGSILIISLSISVWLLCTK